MKIKFAYVKFLYYLSDGALVFFISECKGTKKNRIKQKKVINKINVNNFHLIYFINKMMWITIVPTSLAYVN